jgi:putative CocE/NonD family hydrolase
MNIADGILRCRYRDSWENPQPMVPGSVCEIVVEPYATANLFRAGHRIRVDISSSNFPRYDLNFNTGEPEGAARCKRIATNSVYLDRARASHIVLPVVPAAAFADA